MASSRKSRKPRIVERLAVGLSGGVDSVVLLHLLKSERASARRLTAVHVHHGLSPHADAWAAFCRGLCKRWKIPFVVKKVKVTKAGEGLEAAARRARYEAFREIEDDIALAHTLDDQAETVLMNLLRGAGVRGAAGMPEAAAFHGRRLVRPILSKSRKWVEAYARRHGLQWIEDESNADEALTRNFIRRSVAPLLERKYPKWREALARAARHMAKKEAGKEELLRRFLAGRGLRAPSEAKLAEMLKQLGANGARTLIEHDGARLRKYRNKLLVENPDRSFAFEFTPATGRGIRRKSLMEKPFAIRPRSGGERLQPDPRRPRRTLKNLFQEAGVPPWQRDGLPMLFCGDDLVWVPGIGVDARYQAARGERGLLPRLRVLQTP
jgi:tRNA(Ile)-lysidine synthase